MSDGPNLGAALRLIDDLIIERDKARAENAELVSELRDLRDILVYNGFRPCDSPICNCGGWHHRVGLPERLNEIKLALKEAGHPICNDNGNLVLTALRGLIGERDRLRADNERLTQERDEAQAAYAAEQELCVEQRKELDALEETAKGDADSLFHLEKERDRLLDIADELRAGRDELREAVESSADTFADIALTLRLLHHDIAADACGIAESAMRGVLAGASAKAKP